MLNVLHGRGSPGSNPQQCPQMTAHQMEKVPNSHPLVCAHLCGGCAEWRGQGWKPGVLTREWEQKKT